MFDLVSRQRETFISRVIYFSLDSSLNIWRLKTRQRRPKPSVSVRPLDILVAASLRVCWVPDVVQEAPDLLQIVRGVGLQPGAVPPGLAAVTRNDI